jgi:hypothetical protein
MKGIDMYILENEAHCNINGECIPFGCRVTDEDKNYQYLTLKEIDELRNQFKIKDEGWRHLCFITMLKIEGNKIIHPKVVPQKYIEQLSYMGYDVTLLDYKLETV